MSYYVYELIDPRNDGVFYVGKGKNDRISAHEKEARAGRVSRKCSLIREIEVEGFAIQKRVVKRFAKEQDAYDFEADLIDRYGLSNLTNVIPGGGAASNFPTMSGDRQKIRLFAEYANRTRNGAVVLFIRGQRFDFISILEEYKKQTAVIANRRGIDWVNSVASAFSVEYKYAASA